MARTTTHSKRQMYERLHVSMLDLEFAQQVAAHLIKKGWHSAPYERRGSIYMQQSAFTTSLVVSYARPFKQSNGWPKFPEEFKQYDARQSALHVQLLKLRDQVFAHSDSQSYSIRPFRIEEEYVVIEGLPFLRLPKEECEEVIVMINGIHQRLRPRLDALRRELADDDES